MDSAGGGGAGEGEGTDLGPGSVGAPRRRRFLSLASPWRPPGSDVGGRRCTSCLCCCCLWTCCCGDANKVLPVTMSPTECDFLEIRPHRRLRVVHRLPKAPSGPLVAVPPKLRRSGTTLSRAFVPPSPRSDDHVSESEDEEYWFENAAPRRTPIQQQIPPAAASRRILNKFEPQQPPSIPGIRPPRSSSAASSGPLPAPTSQSSSSPGQRLQRKVIRPPTPEVDLDDEEDLVHDVPEDFRPPVAKVVEDSFVADVLADMSEMVLSITAEATQSGGDDQRRSPQQKQPSSPSASPERSPSPDPECRTVISQPDPAEERESQSPPQSVVITGGHLGGRANVAFETEEDEGQVEESLTHPTEAKESHNDSISSSDDPDTAFVGRNKGTKPVINESIPMQSIPSKEQPEAAVQPFKPILFFLHGVGGSASTWASQIDYFSERGFEIVAPDLLGHGFSSAPDNHRSYTFAKLFRDVLAIFDHYVVAHQRSSALVAHSYGCSLAAALARTRPANVSMLLLLASGGPTPLAPPPGIAVVPRSIFVTCLKPLMHCGFLATVFSNHEKNKYPRGKAMRFQEAFDVPSYVFKHIMAGQSWPEGTRKIDLVIS